MTNKLHPIYIYSLAIFSLAGVLFLAGCATPNVSTHRELHPDEKDSVGGSFIESEDVRTAATKVTGALLSLPEIAGQSDPVYIAIAPVRNSTRYVIDKDMLMARLRVELNRVSQGRVRFLSQETGQETRSQIISAQDEQSWAAVLDECAATITSYVSGLNRTTPATIAVIPVRNCNLAGVNADSMTALLRSRISEKSIGQMTFLAREENGKVISPILAENDLRNLGLVKSDKSGVATGADYFLGGEFVAQSLAAGSPNTSKFLNVMLIDAASGSIPVEKRVLIERKMESGLAKAKYLLTGELRALSKASDGGDRSDWVLMSFQLVEPQSNTILWEDGFETKRQSSAGVVYK